MRHDVIAHRGSRGFSQYLEADAGSASVTVTLYGIAVVTRTTLAAVRYLTVTVGVRSQTTTGAERPTLQTLGPVGFFKTECSKIVARGQHPRDVRSLPC